MTTITMSLNNNPPPCCQKKIYTGEELAKANKRLAIAAYDHASNERYGLGSPCQDDVNKEVARFRRLQYTTKAPSRARRSSSSRKSSSSSSLSSVSESESEAGETYEFRARFVLVELSPGIFRYHVTDDYSNAEALIRATPKLHQIATDALMRKLMSMFGGRNADKHEDMYSGEEAQTLKGARTLPNQRRR